MIRRPLPRLCSAVRYPLVVAAMSGSEGTQVQGIWETAEDWRILLPALIVDEHLLFTTDFHGAQCATWVSEFNQQILGGNARVFVMIHKATERFVDGMLKLADELLDASEGDFEVALYVTGFASGNADVLQRVNAWSRIDDVTVVDANGFKSWVAQNRVACQLAESLRQTTFHERKVV